GGEQKALAVPLALHAVEDDLHHIPESKLRKRGDLESADFDEFDLVSIGILDEGDDGLPVLHRPGLAYDADTLVAERFAGLVDIPDSEGEMAEPGAELVGRRLVPIVGELDHGVGVLRAIADEGVRELAFRIVGLAQQAHSQLIAIEAKRAI